MYSKIINPKTGKPVPVNGQSGKKILKKYIDVYNNQTGGVSIILDEKLDEMCLVDSTSGTACPQITAYFLAGGVLSKLMEEANKQNENAGVEPLKVVEVLNTYKTTLLSADSPTENLLFKSKTTLENPITLREVTGVGISLILKGAGVSPWPREPSVADDPGLVCTEVSDMDMDTLITITNAKTFLKGLYSDILLGPPVPMDSASSATSGEERSRDEIPKKNVATLAGFKRANGTMHLVIIGFGPNTLNGVQKFLLDIHGMTHSRDDIGGLHIGDENICKYFEDNNIDTFYRFANSFVLVRGGDSVSAPTMTDAVPVGLDYSIFSDLSDSVLHTALAGGDSAAETEAERGVSFTWERMKDELVSRGLSPEETNIVPTDASDALMEFANNEVRHIGAEAVIKSVLVEVKKIISQTT